MEGNLPFWASQGLLGAVIAALIPVVVYLYFRVEKLQAKVLEVQNELQEKRIAEGRETLKIVHENSEAFEKVAGTVAALGELIRVVTARDRPSQ